MRIQVQVPGLDCLAKKMERVAKALEDILKEMKENADAAAVAAIEEARSELKTGRDKLAAAVTAQNT